MPANKHKNMNCIRGLIIGRKNADRLEMKGKGKTLLNSQIKGWGKKAFLLFAHISNRMQPEIQNTNTLDESWG